jgi:hypothetical protein
MPRHIERAQCRDERGDIEPGDQATVDQADKRANAERDRHDLEGNEIEGPVVRKIERKTSTANRAM